LLRAVVRSLRRE